MYKKRPNTYKLQRITQNQTQYGLQSKKTNVMSSALQRSKGKHKSIQRQIARPKTIFSAECDAKLLQLRRATLAYLGLVRDSSSFACAGCMFVLRRSVRSVRKIVCPS